MRIASVCASIVLAGATAAAEGAGPVAEGGCGFAQDPVIEAPRVTELRDDDCLVYFTVGPVMSAQNVAMSGGKARLSKVSRALSMPSPMGPGSPVAISVRGKRIPLKSGRTAI